MIILRDDDALFDYTGLVPFHRQITFALTRTALMYFDVN